MWAAWYQQYMQYGYSQGAGYGYPPGYAGYPPHGYPGQERPPLPLPPPHPQQRQRGPDERGSGRGPRGYRDDNRSKGKKGDKGKGKGNGWDSFKAPKAEQGEESKGEGAEQPKTGDDQQMPPKPPTPPPAPSDSAPASASRRPNRWEKGPTMEEVLRKYEEEEEELQIPQIPLRCDIQGQGLGDGRRFRATHADPISAEALGITAEGGKHQVVGPWRLDRDDALRDGELLKNAADLAGPEVYFAAMLVEAVRLHRVADPNSIPAGVISFELQQRPPIAGFGQSQHRVFCRVEHPDETGKIGVVEFPTPWRAKTNLAEEDLWNLLGAYQLGGYNNVKRVINNLENQLRLFC